MVCGCKSLILNFLNVSRRKGIAGHWKSAQGSGILEQVPMNDKYRNWVDAVATLFGGLDICEVEV